MPQPQSKLQADSLLLQSTTQSLCATALITGRNHHSVGFGVITEMSTGYPGYNFVIQKNSATIGTILKENGYATSWFGKNHNSDQN